MVPQEQIQWVLDQPHDVLSVHEARYEKFALNYVLPEHDEFVDRVFLDTIHRKMTRNMSKLQAALVEEVSTNANMALGHDTVNWTEVNVWSVVDKTIFSAVMRVLVGQSICRDDVFKNDMNRFTKAFGYSSILIGRILPTMVKPFLGWILSVPMIMIQKRLLSKWFNPMVRERFAKLERKLLDPDYRYDPPEDLVTWASEALLRKGNAEKCNANDLSRRLAIMVRFCMVPMLV